MRYICAVLMVTALVMAGDALIMYKPDDPKYKETLEHLGGLKIGEEKPVPPWPEK